MNAILQFNKHKYETPLEMLGRLRIERPELIDEKLSYLGRLDPLAHGMMLVAVGEANKEREKYLGLSKTYKVGFLFGISTDTGDVLGLIQQVHKELGEAEHFKNAILNLKGKHTLPYPLYSSKTVDGKPLHEYAREGKEVAVPEREMEVLSVACGDAETVLGEEIAREGISATEHVQGDFRQDKIRLSWQDFQKEYGDKRFIIVIAELSVTGGTYIRSLLMLISEQIHMPCLAYDIERINIDY
ncbi:MAG: hypothetical protein COV34_02490 [Candidatus Zambryskibacteria bacterium CG10_big_fil_rev_8_21_14_0_10_42_12]|uniref:tRNA pseudouridine(55) synthase n=1 Tax=Candidatus Zambryskibacteria bacterium CG10_big_fil_rev_8_21_14_0_10_42_12 TaxID=1975115 RepID=A0A2H0QUH4_9BACT|nr:MAG: hypothetical protein COV34_02490 [Candidatus Zambryskibacteria bacterium CG10_big_fil_rev_8_21_14_0_10_42_12]